MDGAVDKNRMVNHGTTVLIALAALKLGLHLLTNGGYAYFRDEFYYISCSDHLAAGYVDHPPLSIWLLALSRWLLGDSLFAIRFLPAVAGALLVFMTGALARELGGGRFAQGLAALAALCAPVYLAGDNFFSMNAFEPPLWALCAYILIHLLRTDDRGLWVLFGVVAGLGLENKHSMLFLGFGLFVALLLTPQRQHLRDKWLWLGVATAGIIFLPNVLWEVRHQWPTLEFMRNAQTYKNYFVSPGEFLSQQVLILHPLALPIWLAGLYYYLASDAGRRYRLLGWIYVVVLSVFVIEKAKDYYLAPIYPMLLAAGGVAIEQWTQRRRWLRLAYASLLIVGGIVTAPMTLPVLPVETFIRYASALGLSDAARKTVSERHELAELPQYFADMHGWNEIVATVAKAYDGLSPDERARCAIFAQNYGEAGAIDFLGRAYHLPRAISAHNNYWLWEPRGYTGEIVIVVGGAESDLAARFESVVRVDVVRCRYCMPYENNRPIYLCRHLRQPLEQLWPQLKFYM